MWRFQLLNLQQKCLAFKAQLRTGLCPSKGWKHSKFGFYFATVHLKPQICALNRRFIILRRSFYRYICWFNVRWDAILPVWLNSFLEAAKHKTKNTNAAAVRRSSSAWMFYPHINKAAYHPSDCADKHTHPTLNSSRTPQGLGAPTPRKQPSPRGWQGPANRLDSSTSISISS